jgi:hypothetical protein
LGGSGSARPLSDNDLFHIPHYSEEFVSERFPVFSGKVSLRYPNFGDEVDIDRAALMLGGSNTARILAALQTCLEQAPASWWRPNEKDRTIVPALDRITDSPALLELYTRWIRWRDSFRIEPTGPDPSGTVPPAADPMVGG